jgi:hypothetical protein
MSNYCGKKIFSDELIKFLNIKKQPYYLNYIYNAFFEKIKNTKNWNSYKLDDDLKKMLRIEWGSYIKISVIKKQIKEYHVLSTEIPKDIIYFSKNNIGYHVQEICI